MSMELQNFTYLVHLKSPSDFNAFDQIEHPAVLSVSLDNINWLENRSEAIWTKVKFIILIYSEKNGDDLFGHYLRFPKISFLFSEERYAELLPSLKDSNFGEFIDQASSSMNLSSVDKAKVKFEKSFTLTNTEERWLAYSEIKELVEPLPCFLGFPDIVGVIASELITNGFFDAYRDVGTDKPVSPDRKSKFSLPEGHSVRFDIFADDEFLWLYVKDTFGTLNKADIFRSLHRAATEKTVKLDSDGGAGLGLYMIFLWASEMIFKLTENQSTEILCKLKITKRNLIFEKQKATLIILG